MNMPVPIVLVVDTKGCLQTNYGDVMMLYQVSRVLFWLVHVHYINMHLSLFFDVVFTQVHCLPTNYDDNYCRHNIVGILLSMLLDSILVSSVVRVSVPFTELHEHACSCFGTLFTNKL